MSDESIRIIEIKKSVYEDNDASQKGRLSSEPDVFAGCRQYHNADPYH